MGITGNRISKAISLLIFLIPMVSFSQQPFINSISPTNAEVGRTVDISGLNFSGSPRVFFGGVEASILPGASNNLIQAIVPAGASNASIYVLNNGEIAQSSKKFFISFVGNEIDLYDPEHAVSTGEPNAGDVCLCDLNGDNKNDIVLVHDRETSSVTNSDATIFLNNTTGTDAFTGTDFQVSQSLNVANHDDGFKDVVCGDFDNDGDNDLALTSVASASTNDVFILSNPGTGVFPINATVAKALPITASGNQRQPVSIVSADIDRDGLLDLIVGNNAKDGIFHIFRNTSSGGSVSFSNATEIETNVDGVAGELISTGILYAADFNNDGLQDIATTAFRETNARIHLFRNQSVLNNFNFTYDGSVSNGGQVSDIEAGDLDNDGDLEIVVASNLLGRVSFFENLSGSIISFSDAINLSSSVGNDTGVSLGDINGDGLLDIAVTNAETNVGGVFILPNTTSSSISFGDEEIQSTDNKTTGFIITGDLNGDAKPDLAYSREVISSSSSIGIILNRNCIVPKISPQDIEFCIGQPFTLRATNAANATYNWQVSTNGTITTNGNSEAEFTINSGNSATINVTITQDGCARTTQLITDVFGGTPPGNPTIDGAGTGELCIGENITLSSSITSDNYFWTLPDGTEVNTENISLNPVSAEDAGTYTLRIQNTDGCTSDEVSTTLSISSPPELTIISSGISNFCDEIILQVPDYSSDNVFYQWKEGGANLGTADENDASVTISQSGTYSLEATNLDNCASESASITVNKINLPVSIIEGPGETCEDFLSTFIAASTGEAGFSLQYEWSIEDATSTLFTSTANTIDFTFDNVGDYTVTLTTNYDPNEVYPGPNAAVCGNTTVLNVTVSPPPTITFDQPDGIQKCQNESLTVGISSPLDSETDTYSWSIINADATDNSEIRRGSNATIDVTTPVGVDSVYAVLNILTSIGCEVSDSIKVRNFITDADISSTDFSTIIEEDSATLEDAISISLTAENIVSNISWEPAELIDNPTGTTIQYFPRTPSSVVTLSGIDGNGCNVSTQVEIYLDNIRPKKTFSPNGDGVNDCWEILNIGDLGAIGGCEVYIFDSRGRNLTNSISSFTDGNCVWNGTSSGSDVPEGIYYFVLKCDQEEFSKSGSILLAR